MLFVGAGREAGIRPGDLVGAITGEAGIKSGELGAIQIADRFSLVEVPESRADEIIAALRATTIRGRKVPVRRDRDASIATIKKKPQRTRDAKNAEKNFVLCVFSAFSAFSAVFSSLSYCWVFGRVSP